MMRMRHAACLVAIAFAAAAARADDVGERRFVVEIGARDPELRADCSRRLSAWWDEMTSAENVPPGWDAAQHGPWPLVVKSSGQGFVQDGPGVVEVFLNVVAPELKSRSDTAEAFAWRLLEGLRTRVAARAAAVRDPAHGRATADNERARLAADALRLRSSELERAHGGPPDRRSAFLWERLAASERDAAQARIDRAVAGKQLETARAAVDRAIDLDRLRRDADDVARTVAAEPRAEARAALEQKLAQLRAKVDELARTTPPLDSARVEAFRLEVVLVGLESRTTALAADVAELRAAAAAAQDDARRHAPLVRELVVAENEADRTRDLLRRHAETASAREPAFEVIRAPGPFKAAAPAPKEERR